MRKRLAVCLLALLLAVAVAVPPVAQAADGGHWHQHVVCFGFCFTYLHWHPAETFKKSCEKCYEEYVACNAAAGRDLSPRDRAIKRGMCSDAHGRCIADPQCRFPWPYWFPNGHV